MNFVMLECTNKTLFEELSAKNIILRNGQINTRYKYLIQKNFPLLKVENRFDLFVLIWDHGNPKCEICSSSTLPSFKNPKFTMSVTSEEAFSNVCSYECGRISSGRKMSVLMKTPEHQSKRVLAFKKAISQIEINGKTKASNIAIKAASTKRADLIDGKNGIERQTEKAKRTKIANGHSVADEFQNPFYIYRKRVHNLSKKEPSHLLVDSEKRGHYNNNGYHLDHIFSICDGYKLKIPAEIIASIVNLRFIPAVQNSGKGRKSDQSLADLIGKYQMYKLMSYPLEMIIDNLK